MMNRELVPIRCCLLRMLCLGCLSPPATSLALHPVELAVGGELLLRNILEGRTSVPVAEGVGIEDGPNPLLNSCSIS
jgi:hypothetical protein